MAALRRHGHRVAPFKVGPDYIDPGYHTLAAGRPGRNLDPVLVGEHRIAPLFRHGARGADTAIVEGVMGLFDGRIGHQVNAGGFGSTAHVAELIDAPVLLVVDTRGQSTSLAALLHGFRSYRPGVRMAGVILNQVGSDRHEQVLREACADVGLPVLGSVRRAAEVDVPSRHLGLIPAAEHGTPALRAVAAMADLVAASVDVDAVVQVARSAPAFDGPQWNPKDEVKPTAGRPVIAVAGGPAFTFGYAEHTELLRAAGAEVAIVDPIRDDRLPEGTAGLVLPGGFPEAHAEALSANEPLRNEVATLARSGAPVHAECGGLLYLVTKLDGQPMCGVLDAEAAMSPRLLLGYRDAVAAGTSPLHPEGTRVSGHEFHRTHTMPAHGETPAWIWRDHEGAIRREGFVQGGLHASYLHTHPAGNPEAIQAFTAACRGRV
ncbi:hydrogenobyrinic acid a,c-diamide synthase (glutamine-hydrolysing) /cobyrinate a,c-diamide synthase [Actinokineospora iranica]|uniref:Hydrogenobyrinic acid a,c-diamide synthase (Glutamine-hydrolysing) /cobyrinate a,c-diamide synthase n=2 Tax=Actinokineospora iranica TaxID=1271860 RepID=A0A1G6J4W8_9PSEU|nr:hydrogenobyrinic acid a,c-diamide synthase (glutamine-hydrolysing) /cobyrinate a,c-diamide synthase [Actinokineospora iranica]